MIQNARFLKIGKYGGNLATILVCFKEENTDLF